MLDLTADGLRVRGELDGVRGDLSAARERVAELEGEVAQLEEERVAERQEAQARSVCMYRGAGEKCVHVYSIYNSCIESYI
jgi:hypothetical protein